MPANFKLQPRNEAYLRYNKGIQRLINLANDDQEIRNLQAMVVQEFTEPQLELSNDTVKEADNGIIISFFTNSDSQYRLYIRDSKANGRSKQLQVNIGRPPEQSDLADQMRAMNFTFKFFASVSKEELKTITPAETRNIFQQAGADDERLLIRTAANYGGPLAWAAVRDRRTPALDPSILQADGEAIFRNQQERVGNTSLLLTKSIGEIENEQDAEVESAELIKASLSYYTTGSESEKMLLEMKKQVFLHKFLGGLQQRVDPRDDLRSPYLASGEFNRDRDIVILLDERDVMELNKNVPSWRSLRKLRHLMMFVNLPTYKLLKYIENLVEEEVQWYGDVDSGVIASFLPPGGIIHRMKYGNNELVLYDTYHASDIANGCKTNKNGWSQSGFLWRYYVQRQKSRWNRKRRHA